MNSRVEKRPVFSPPVRGDRNAQAFTLVEVIVAVTLIAVMAVGATQAMLAMNSQAMANRVMTNARVIVQDQINAALTINFAPSATPPVVPAMLQIGTSTSVVPIAVDSTGATLIQGNMTRTVESVNNPLNVTMRRFSSVLVYNYLGRSYQVGLSTVRAPDIQ